MATQPPAPDANIRDMALTMSTVGPLLFDDGMHVTAASGAVKAGRFLYVAQDDQLQLGVFEEGVPRGRRAQLFEGSLPGPLDERKRAKPDIEALTIAPVGGGRALLALGSGSSENRRRGGLWPLTGDGALTGEPRAIDLTAPYAALTTELAELNIEGACVRGDKLLLAQRGNGREGNNAIVSVALDPTLAGEAAEFDVQPHDLGDIEGIPLTFTDLVLLPSGNVMFSAAAEDTDDPYLDGPCLGSALGVIDAAGEVIAVERLERIHKIEGVAVDWAEETILLVEDPDDASRPSSLFSLLLPEGWR